MTVFKFMGHTLGVKLLNQFITAVQKHQAFSTQTDQTNVTLHNLMRRLV